MGNSRYLLMTVSRVPHRFSITSVHSVPTRGRSDGSNQTAAGQPGLRLGTRPITVLSRGLWKDDVRCPSVRSAVHEATLLGRGTNGHSYCGDVTSGSLISTQVPPRSMIFVVLPKTRPESHRGRPGPRSQQRVELPLVSGLSFSLEPGK